MASLAFQWLIMMIIPNISNFSEAGVFTVAVSVCSIFNIIATFFMYQFQVADQYEKFTENDYFVCRMFTIGLSFVLCTITVIVLGYSLEQCLTTIFYMLYRNMIHFAYLHEATFQINSHMDYSGKCMILEGIMSFVSFIASYMITHNLVISVLIMAIIGGGAYVLSMSYGYKKMFGRKYPCRFVNIKVLKILLPLGIPLLASGVTPTIITALPKLTLQWFWGDELVGIFGTLTAPTIIIPTLVSGVFSPFIVYFSNLAKKGDISTIRKQYLKAIGIILGFGVICLAISILFAGPVFKLLYGEEIVQYTWYFNILVIGIILHSIGMCGITVLVTKEQGKYAAIGSVLSLAIAAAIFLLTIPKFGFDAATFGLVGAYGAFALILSLFALFEPLNIKTDSNQ